MTSRDHNSEIGLLAAIAVGVIVLMGFGHYHSTEQRPFDPSAYLVVLTLIVGAIKERWTQRSVDRMGDQLAVSAPPNASPQDVRVVNPAEDPVQTEDAR